MATEDNNSESGQEPVKKKKLLTVAIAVALGLLAGGGAGAFAAGSLLPKSAAAAAPAETSASSEKEKSAEDGSEAEGEEEHAGEGGEEAAGDHAEGTKGEPGAATPTYLMENLVLNPAGTGGTRFLMVSVAFGVKDEAAAESMKARDHEVRDAMLGVLGTKTVGQLADIAVRDSIKSELVRQVGGLFPKGTVKRVYFPQFVIQ